MYKMCSKILNVVAKAYDEVGDCYPRDKVPLELRFPDLY